MLDKFTHPHVVARCIHSALLLFHRRKKRHVFFMCFWYSWSQKHIFTQSKPLTALCTLHKQEEQNSEYNLNGLLRKPCITFKVIQKYTKHINIQINNVVTG